MRPPRTLLKVITSLQDGPLTVKAIGFRCGLSESQAGSAVLYLRRAGMVVEAGKVHEAESCRPVWQYLPVAGAAERLENRLDFGPAMRKERTLPKPQPRRRSGSGHKAGQCYWRGLVWRAVPRKPW